MSSPSLRSWKLEGSLNGEEWTTLDELSADSSPLNVNQLDRYPVPNHVESRFIRLTQVGQSARHDNILRLSNFDVFGTLSYIAQSSLGNQIAKHDQQLQQVVGRLSHLETLLNRES
jgi:hypothetical protein